MIIIFMLSDHPKDGVWLASKLAHFLPNIAPFSGNFFAQFWGPRDGSKARVGHHVSAYG